MRPEEADLRARKALEYLSTCWTPHAGQKKAGEAVFNSPADLVYIECGRKFGKSELSTFMCWIKAIMKPNSEVYYLAPAVKLAKELVWANQRMQTCNTYDPEFIKNMERILGGEIQIFRHEMRIVLPNGSFIKIDGSDNIDNQLGLKPDFVVADEYRTFKSEWIEFMRPNMAPKKGKIVFISTPPLGPNHAYEMALECRAGMSEGDPGYFYLNLPSQVNDRLPGHDKWLEKEKQRLYRLGREKEWQREYMAKYLTSDENAVIPHISRHTICTHESTVNAVKNRRNDRIEWYCTLNPGNSTVMAAILGGINYHTGDVYLLGEVKLWDSKDTSVRNAWPKVEEMINRVITEVEGQFCLKDVRFVTHERAPWFARDLYDVFKIPSMFSSRECKQPDFNIGLIKDIAISKKLYVSEKMSEFVKEVEQYQRNPKTFKIPLDDTKVLIYNFRALLAAGGYTTEMLEHVYTPTSSEVQNDDEHFRERMANKRSFDDVCRAYRMEQYGILGDEDEVIFGEDIDDYL